MSIRDRELSKKGVGAMLQINHPLAPTASKTNRPYLIASPGKPWQLDWAYIMSAAYTADLDLLLTLMDDNEIISSPTLAIDAGGLAEDFEVAAFVARVNGKFVEKAAAGVLGFSAAHQITALKWGAICIQMDDAGTISSKVVGAVQAYDTEAAARAAIPAADAAKLKIGQIVIQAKVGVDWDANTDDMTDASDVTTAVFESEAVSYVLAVAAAVSPVAMKKSPFALSATPANYKDTAGTKDLVALATTDGNIVLTNGVLHVGIRGIGSN